MTEIASNAATTGEPVAIQDTVPDNHCVGCGPDNPHGLRIKSFWSGDLETVCVFEPAPHMASAPPSIVNGGIIATLVDCHSVCTAVAYGRRLDGIGPLMPGALYATGSLNISYLRPAPIDRPLELRARIVGVAERKTVVECTVTSDGVCCATATVVAARVAAGWGRGGSRVATQAVPAPAQTLGGWAAGSPEDGLARTA
ncbi:MAG: PaaI family thioesterase [Thermoanaerobaculales bacterium]|jgi:acyl-coenzyme A thioesterase PaaI-like protein|nr:PaaI family thioesterase [Thermoanaerobaculales bacterium]